MMSLWFIYWPYILHTLGPFVTVKMGLLIPTPNNCIIIISLLVHCLGGFINRGYVGRYAGPAGGFAGAAVTTVGDCKIAPCVTYKYIDQLEFGHFDCKWDEDVGFCGPSPSQCPITITVVISLILCT